ncbi:hypothetical protein CP02DC14_2312 [Chlamydia psittaci 02DC14]|nr:hypothetical protein CP02DC21_1510 [Chlamydia psittaci 02DC21]EPJ19334.1 hypothetical protein CP02DC23_1120 [Chlamydia psittaci 02DC23]EPJ26204.1 hypothetical protein CP03DC29_1330 [Chlamydia psittaci 03DC29]EPJ27710.1 hypothetical protein CP09DC78_1129 [Chlamydia psittaci 09DC78]EPL00678.1 hypothetical protein CP02DC14_2312 [Chlamydia psittaci 02DC14]
MIRSHLVKPGFSRSKPVSAVLVWFEPVKTGLWPSFRRSGLVWSG